MEKYTLFMDWKNYYCLNYPKAIYRVNAISVKILMAFLTETEQITFKIVRKHKRTQIAKQFWERTELGESYSHISDYITEATVIKSEWYQHRNRHIDQWNRIEIPEINSHTWSINLQQKTQEYNLRKDSLFNKWC